jgi:serine/threonine protein kinase
MRGLTALIKADLRWRFARGDRPSVAEYLDRFPILREARERMVSLVYEEYCLREERGEGIDTEEFCGRYSSLKDSIASQLRYHRMFSQIVGSTDAIKFPRAGEEFLRFRLLKEMGRGGSARVFQAEEMDLGRRLVVLKISPDKGEEPSIQGRLDHPHIARVLSVVRPPEGGLRGLTMPYRPGKTLDDVIRRIQPATRPTSANVFRDVLADLGAPALPSVGWHGFPKGAGYARGVAWLMSKIARALAHAHERQILHRDVKPANILLTTTDGPVLLDFNLACAPNTTDEAVAALRGGTLPYMAPEQLLAFLDDSQWESVKHPADIYAVGLILTELLTGCRPQVPDAELPLPRAIGELLDSRMAPRRSVHSQNPTVPHALDAVITRCLQHRPEDRYASASALADDLEAIAAGEPLRHAVNDSLVENSISWVSRKRVHLAVGVAAILLIGVATHFILPIITNRFLEAAETAIKTNRFEVADEKLRIASWLSPQDPRVEDALGKIELSKKNYPRAIDRFNQSLAFSTANPELASPLQLSGVRFHRAQANMAWSSLLQSEQHATNARGLKSNDFAVICDRVIQARNDLRQAERAANADPALLLRIGVGKLQAEIMLGEIDSDRDQPLPSFEHYVYAAAAVENLRRSVMRSTPAVISQAELAQLEKKINQGLAVEMPRMLGID